MPRLSFSSAVSKLPDHSAGTTVYRVKIQNTGRRPIIDLSIRARVYLPHVHLLRPGTTKTTTIIEVPLDLEHIFILRPGHNRLAQLQLDRVAVGYEAHLDQRLGESLRGEKNGSLEALMRLSDGGYLIVQALAYDAVSGARKYYASPHYTVDSFVSGPFKGLTVDDSASHPQDPQELVLDGRRSRTETGPKTMARDHAPGTSTTGAPLSPRPASEELSGRSEQGTPG